MKTLKLFNAVIARAPAPDSTDEPLISEDGFIIEPQALWAQEQIIAYYQRETLTGEQLNQTFHKSWAKIKNSTRFELYLEQIKHYISTYGSDFQSELHLPDEVLNVPQLKITFKVIKAYSREELIDQCLQLLTAGIALKEETIDELLAVLVDELEYTFTGDEQIRNKEAIVKIAQMYGVLPKDTMDFFRYIILMTTGESLLIKSPEVIQAIKDSKYNPSAQFKAFGLAQLAAIFNRFKPLFLAYKNKCPKTINKISKLSKKHHKPLVSNPLNQATFRALTERDLPWCERATPFMIFKALSACYQRSLGQTSFLYRVRNGKSWVPLTQHAASESHKELNAENYLFLMEYLKSRYDLSGQTFFLPKDVDFALPTSEKMFVGEIPTGTRFFGTNMAIGIYWRNEWGARDLDLSGLNLLGKVGWNSDYSQSGTLMYSGDITDAPEGAVEYLYAAEGLEAPTLVKNNVYSGSPSCQYKIIVGRGDEVDYEYMMDPNKCFVEVKCQSVQKQMILGMLIPQREGQSFTLLNFGAGHTRVAGSSEVSKTAIQALYQQWSDPLSFNDLIVELGAEVVDDPQSADFNFELNSLERSSFIKVFRR